MIDYYDLSDKAMVPSKKLRQYMYNTYSDMVEIAVNNQNVTLKGNDGAYVLGIWTDGSHSYSLSIYLQLSNPRMYKKLRYGLFGRVMTLQNPAGRKFAEICYKIAQKTFGFN